MDLNTSEKFNPVQLSDGRTVWLQLSTDTGELLYKGARLHEGGSRIAPATRSDDKKEVWRAIRLRVALEQVGFWESPSRSRWQKAFIDYSQAKGRYKTKDLWEAIRLGRLEARLKQYRPEYSAMSPEDKVRLLEGAFEKAKAERDAQAFFEYGGPGGLSTRPADIDDAERDIRAAELKKVLGLSWPKIGKVLGIPRGDKQHSKSEEYYKTKGSSKHASDAGARGRRLLLQALSEEEYNAHIETVKPDLEHWHSLSQDEQLKELALDELGKVDHRTLDRKEREKVEAEVVELFRI